MRDIKIIESAFGDFSARLESFGTPCNSYLTSRDRLAQTPAEIVDQIVKYLSLYTELIDEVTDNGLVNHIGDTRLLVEKFLTRFGLKFADASFLEYLDEGDILEIYTVNHFQLFTTPRFFELSSYDSVTMAIYPWKDLWKRPEGIVEQMVAEAETIIAKGTPLTRPKIDRHVLREIFGTANKAFDYEVCYAGAVFTNTFMIEKIAGYATIIKVRELS